MFRRFRKASTIRNGKKCIQHWFIHTAFPSCNNDFSSCKLLVVATITYWKFSVKTRHVILKTKPTLAEYLKSIDSYDVIYLGHPNYWGTMPMAVFTFFEQCAELNDDVLFGEVWSREDKLSSRDRSIVTVTTLMASGILDSSLKFHLANAKKHGVTQEEIAEIITHAAFMPAGQKPGLPLIWQKKSGKRTNYKINIGYSTYFLWSFLSSYSPIPYSCNNSFWYSVSMIAFCISSIRLSANRQ